LLGTIGSAGGAAMFASPGRALVSPSLANQRLEGLACNMESWWTDLPFMQRFEQAAAHGFSAVEFWNYAVVSLPSGITTRLQIRSNTPSSLPGNSTRQCSPSSDTSSSME
jgi:hypothetical protein